MQVGESMGNLNMDKFIKFICIMNWVGCYIMEDDRFHRYYAVINLLFKKNRDVLLYNAFKITGL